MASHGLNSLFLKSKALSCLGMLHMHVAIPLMFMPIILLYYTIVRPVPL